MEGSTFICYISFQHRTRAGLLPPSFFSTSMGISLRIDSFSQCCLLLRVLHPTLMLSNFLRSSVLLAVHCFRNLLVSVITNVFPFLESQTRISSKVQTLDTPRDPWPWGCIFTLWERCRWRIPSVARLLMWEWWRRIESGFANHFGTS
ncbi:hypothetical protein M378DRAFT_1008996 [Amanita muscaria Koide BX008]|uniref:Uncharacterized protein n=1 Tax=Amanita muscaria (strain Koide BX008) TaxID=946122 RepID=A0A0C2S9B1_AMAMK|nr:hypothetical protein M378DRAFT_1008996 [Amanita muscaria Koide BX008]